MVKITYTEPVPERKEHGMYIVTVNNEVTYNIYVIRRHHIIVDAEDEEPREVCNSIGQAIKWIEELYKDQIVSCDFLDIKVSVKETKYEEVKKPGPKKWKAIIIDPVTGKQVELNEMFSDETWENFKNSNAEWREALNKAEEQGKAEKHKFDHGSTFDPYNEAADKMREAMNEFKKAFSNNPKLTEEAKIKHARKQWFNGWFQEWNKTRAMIDRARYPQWLTEEVKRTAPYTQYEVDKAKTEAGFAQQQRRADERERWDRYTYIRHMFAFDKEFGTGKEEQKARPSGFSSFNYGNWADNFYRDSSKSNVRVTEDEVTAAYNAYLFARNKAQQFVTAVFKSRFDSEKIAYYNRYIETLNEFLKYHLPYKHENMYTLNTFVYMAPCGTAFTWNPYGMRWVQIGETKNKP